MNARVGKHLLGEYCCDTSVPVEITAECREFFRPIGAVAEAQVSIMWHKSNSRSEGSIRVDTLY